MCTNLWLLVFTLGLSGLSGLSAFPILTSFVPLYNELLDDPVPKFNTDLMYAAFGHVNSSCEFDFEFPNESHKLKNLVGGTLISLGWGQNDIPMIETCVQTFADSVKRFTHRHKLVGFDIDYENPIFSTESKFIEVSTALRIALPRPLLLTITPATLMNIHIPTLNDVYDLVNIQSYWSTAIPYLEAGVVASKIVVGVDVESGESYKSAVGQVRDLKLAGVYVWTFARDLVDLFDIIRFELNY